MSQTENQETETHVLSNGETIDVPASLGFVITVIDSRNSEFRGQNT